MPFMPLGFAPGEWDWMNRRRGGGILGPAEGGGLLGGITEKLTSPQAQLGLQLLANSGPSRERRGFGQILGQSALGVQQARAQQQDNDLRRQYMQAQIEQMRQPPARKPIAVVGPDGKPIYVAESDAIGQSPYLDPQGNSQSASSIQEYNEAQRTGYKGTYLDFIKAQAQARHVAQPADPLVAVQTQDGRSVYLPRSQAAGMTPASPREGALPTEGERTSGNYHDRMTAAEGKLGDYTPSLTDFVAANQLMSGGPVRAGAANAVLSPEGQKYYQAAADWVRAKLRKESGAVISPEEMAQEIKTYFPVPGDTPATIEQKRKARRQATAGMRQMAGRAITQTASVGGMPIADDPLGILK